MAFLGIGKQRRVSVAKLNLGSGGRIDKLMDELAPFVVARIPTGIAVINLYQSSIGDLTPEIVDREGNIVDGEPPFWTLNPERSDLSQTWSGHVKQVIFSLLLTGNSYTQIIRDGDGMAIELVPCPMGSVVPFRDIDGTAGGEEGAIAYRKSFNNLIGLRDGDIFRAEDILHIRINPIPGSYEGRSPFQMAKRVLKLADILQVANIIFYERGINPIAIAGFKGDFTKDQIKEWHESIANQSGGTEKANSILGLSGVENIAFVPTDKASSPYIEPSKSIGSEIARLGGVSEVLLGGASSAQNYDEIGAAFSLFARQSLSPVVRGIEDAYSRLIEDPDIRLRLNLNDLLKGDSIRQIEERAKSIRSGGMNINEIRKIQGLPDYEDENANKPLVSRDLIPLDQLQNLVPSPATSLAEQMESGEITMDEVQSVMEAFEGQEE